MFPVYIRENRIRSQRFQIETKIVKENGNKFVLKRALDEAGKFHISDILKGYELLKRSIIGNQLKLPRIINVSENYVLFEYIEGVSYTNLILNKLITERKKGFEKLLFDFFELLKRNIKSTNFTVEKKWFQFFDEEDKEYFKNDLFFEVGAIDLIFENIIISDRGYFIVDMEWVFDEQIPFSFIIYRTITYFYQKNYQYLHKLYSIESLLKLFGITKEKQEIFFKVENRFQNYVYKEKSNSLKSIYLKKNIEFNKINNLYSLLLYQDYSYAQLFFDIGNGFNERDSEKIYLDLKNKSQIFSFDLTSLKDIKALRIDPLTLPIVIEVNKIILFTKTRKIELGSEIKSNAVLSYPESNTYFFESDDPQIYLEVDRKILREATNIEFDFNYLHISNEALRVTAKQLLSEISKKNSHISELENEISKKNSHISELENEISKKNSHISELENEIIGYVTSKSWKITRPLRQAKRLIKRILGRR